MALRGIMMIVLVEALWAYVAEGGYVLTATDPVHLTYKMAWSW